MDDGNSDFYCDFVLNDKIKVNIIKETDMVLAFFHTKPSWAFHVVIVPKTHISNITELKDLAIIEEIFKIAQEIINNNNLKAINYRIITNGGGFQDSKHLHFHLVSGDKL
ncbi:MAG: HIT domain-containing protein [Patescibacteria group bacterium]|jgi:histidine triad (HIT) family protein